MLNFLNNHLSLRVKILGGFASIILVAAGIWFLFFSNISENILQAEIEKYFQILANETHSHLENEIGFRLNQVEIQSRTINNYLQLSTSNQLYEATEDRMDYISLVDKQWQAGGAEDLKEEILNNSLSVNLREDFLLSEYYLEQNDREVFVEAIVTNQYGMNIAMSHITTDYYQADEEWWQRAREEGSHIGGVRYDESVDQYVVDVATLIRDENGEFIGVLRAALSIDSIVGAVEALNTDIRTTLGASEGDLKSLELSLIDADATTIYSSNETIEPFTPFPQELLSGVNDGRAALITVNYGEQMVVASDGSENDKLNWTLVLSAELAEVYTPIGQMRFELFIVILVIVFTGLLLGGWYANSLIRPITGLTTLVNQIAKGNFEKKIPSDFTKRSDELGVLATAFSKMSNDLYNLYTELDAKVKKRTAALAKAKARAEREKAQDEAILLSIGEGLVVTDNAGKIEFVNKAFCEQLGWDMQAVRGQQLSEVVPTFDPETEAAIPQEEQILARVLGSSETDKNEQNIYYFERKDGTRFPASVTVSPILHNDKVVGAVEVFRDITHEQAVDKAKTEFVSLASHQLRTPLSTINWYTEMLLAEDAGKLKKEQKDYLREIYKGNQRMVTLVNALLNVSRIELGTLSVDPKPTDVIALAKESIEEQRPHIEEKNITVETDFDKLEPVKLDPNLLHIVYQNLISNSVKYTPAGGSVVVAVKDKGDAFLIQIKDTGMGIPDYQKDDIFTKLFRADNVKEQETTGTGLGLYLVKKIVDQAQGEISFESVEKEGTTFYVTIPKRGMSKKVGSKKLETNT